MVEDSEAVLYMPVLKWKLGEQTALNPLSAAQKSIVLPIAELQDRPYDWVNRRYKKSWDDHIDAVAKATVGHWGKIYEIGFDQDIMEDHALVSHHGSSWEYLFERLWASGVQAVPVLSSRAGTAEIVSIVGASKQAGRSRYIFRYRIAAPIDGNAADEVDPAAIAAWAQQRLAFTGASPSNIDVVFDCNCVAQWNPHAKAPWVAAVIAAIHDVARWRRVFLLSGGFPKNLAGIPRGTHQLPRHDWALYNATYPLIRGRGHHVGFADYAISHVDPFEEDPRLLKMAANLRYTHADRWFVIKGTSVRDNGFEQYRDMCRLLVGLPIYLQQAFSHGDKNYHDVATSVVAGPGNATHWRRDGTNHHLHVVLRQLAGGSLP